MQPACTRESKSASRPGPCYACRGPSRLVEQQNGGIVRQRRIVRSAAAPGRELRNRLVEQAGI